jgi:general secretion pathway protein G
MTRRIQGLQRGFTLIEIMVVVVIIGLLSAVVVANVFGRVDESRVNAARQDLHTYETSVDLYKIDNFTVPTTEQGLKALAVKPADPNVTQWKGPYVRRLNKDPWKREYYYESPGTHGGEYDVWTYGADGKPGGEGTAADIGNWNLGE